MQTHIHALIIFYVDCDRLLEVQRPAISGFDAFKIGGDDVIGFAGGNALGEFTGVIGIEFPVRLFAWGAVNLDFDTVDGMIVGSPDGAENKGIVIGGLEFAIGSAGRLQQGRNRSEEKDQQERVQKAMRAEKPESSASEATRHRLRSPLLLPHLRSLPRRLSIPRDWW